MNHVPITSGHVVLVGMMGTGKSTVGALLADRLGRHFYDSDAVIVDRAGCSIPEIFSRDGEAGFRSEEAKVISDLLSGSVPAVVALGGGAVVDPATRARLADELVVWLVADHDELASRLDDGAGRPMLADDVADNVERLSRDRDPLYAEVARIVVDTTAMTPDTVTDAVLDAVLDAVSEDVMNGKPL